jgi:hypothetical protein
MSQSNLSKLTCHTDNATGFLKRIDFTAIDGTVTKSVDVDVSSGHSVTEHTFVAGERLSFAKASVKKSTYE